MILDLLSYFREKNIMMENKNKSQLSVIEDALVSASIYISNNIEAICDEDYLQESEQILAEVNNALDILKMITEKA